MKIKQLKIEGFGKLVNQTYDLSDLTIFLGENEAGKSTILAFIKYMLFGFENATNTNRNFNPLAVKNYGGQIFLTHAGKSVSIERLKILRTGKPSFSCQIDGNEIDETAWLNFIKPMNAKLFDDIYSVTQENLQISSVKDYNAERLDAEWRMSATTGSIALFDQTQALFKARDAIFTTTRATKKPVNQLLADIAMVQVEIADKTVEEVALFPLMAESQQLTEKIADFHQLQEQLAADVNQIKHQLSFLTEYQEYTHLLNHETGTILSPEEAENLRRQHALHGKYLRETVELTRKIFENETNLEKLDTPKNQFLKRLETLEKFHDLKADYPRALAAEQRVTQLVKSETKIFLIFAVISLILMVAMCFIKPILGLIFLLASGALIAIHFNRNRNREKETTDNQAVVFAFNNKLAYFSDWLALANKDLPEKMAGVIQLDEEAQALQISLTRFEQSEHMAKLAEVKALDEAIFAEIPDIETAPKLLAQWDKQSQNILRLARLKEQLADIFDLSKPFDGNVAQHVLNQKMSEKIVRAAEIKQLIDKKARNLAIIERQKTDTTLADLAAKLARKRELLRDYVVEFATKSAEITLTQQVMSALSSETLPDILSRASDFLSTLTNQTWQQIYLEQDVLWVKNAASQSLRLLDLSTGTRDQLQLALRLAFVQSKKLDFPLFLDDNFLRFDQKRRENFAKMLDTIAQTQQVIVLTSDVMLTDEGVIKL
ncbi:DNA repair ATPase [Lactococcus hodotermopsidis]|uniref:DNA repair ATPase n=1 Tax=Pseudolactococcus hodotermopsidis TaxID=2709157 RepID=A0A6A0BD34_9LACT|nr:AAA family ATPase [Lactococcus hodotermopsidis]GFH42364.1 DNA repair ATPase [Lactococcus hodotermopsidis]